MFPGNFFVIHIFYKLTIYCTTWRMGHNHLDWVRGEQGFFYNNINLLWLLTLGLLHNTHDQVNVFKVTTIVNSSIACVAFTLSPLAIPAG
jgi:hypothetical protein